MTIKEVSEKFDITADTLRYYERVGLIPPVARNASSKILGTIITEVDFCHIS